MTQAPLPTRVDLSDSPVDLATLDELFPPDPVITAAQLPSADVPPQAAPSAPPTGAADEPFIRGSNSVYKSKEAAVEGINQKDAVIEQLRQQYTLATGIDPLTRQPVGQPTRQPETYVSNARKYVADLRAAKTDEELLAVQTKLVMDTLQPMAPAISGVTRAAATRQIEAEIPDFQAFYNSPEYKTTLAQVPAMKEAIEMAEGNITFHPRLPELYKTVYLVSRGIQLPELLKRNTTQNQSQNPPAGTPTATPTTPTPPNAVPSNGRTVRTGEGRKQIIADFEAKYTKNIAW